MNVTLISYTPEADIVLLFTKSTRLTMSPSLIDDIRMWPPEKKQAELAYMARTIPSSWEFVDYTFLVEGVSRAYTHQQVRTRHGSYAQQSMRVVNMGEFDYIYPETILKHEDNKKLIDQLLLQIKWVYKTLVDAGVAEEDARGILPTNIATNIVCKFNLRTFVELAKARTGGRTQEEYRMVINAMVDEVLRIHPWAKEFLFGAKERNYFEELETFAVTKFPKFSERSELLKIIDAMRKET